MRASAIAGIVLIIVGAFLFYRGGSFTTREDVLKVGDLKVSTEERHSIEPWVAGAAVVGGAVLLLVGAASRKAS
jgi:hypothetical protein